MNIAYQTSFLRQYKKLTKELQDEAKEKIEIFKKDQNCSTLKVHKLKGPMKKMYSFSVNYSYRIVFEIINKETVFLEIGNHDLYK